MAHDFLIYDFGTNEETAQSARRKVEGWAQSYRLGKKLTFKFDREEGEGAEDDGAETAVERESEHDHEREAKSRNAKFGKKTGAQKKSDEKKAGRVHGIVRLDFSPHEKLSHQRWLDRIPTEEPFKSAKGKVVRAGHEDHADAAERFDELA
jgi:hypothetical protein